MDIRNNNKTMADDKNIGDRYDDFFITKTYSDNTSMRTEKTLRRKDKRLGDSIVDTFSCKSSNVVKIEHIRKSTDGSLIIITQKSRLLSEYLDDDKNLQISEACQLINDMIQGLKDMAKLGLIYDISADMFAVVDNRCIVNPRNILMLLPKTDLSSISYLSAKYRIIRREKYIMSQLYYLICELLRNTRSGPQLPKDVIDQCSLKSDSKATINLMYENKITIDQIKNIEFVGEQTKNSEHIEHAKVNDFNGDSYQQQAPTYHPQTHPHQPQPSQTGRNPNNRLLRAAHPTSTYHQLTGPQNITMEGKGRDGRPIVNTSQNQVFSGDNIPLNTNAKGQVISIQSDTKPCKRWQAAQQ